MKALNTRFNPTTNGDIHIGHLFTALVNKTEAEQSNGKFFVRFDDDQEIWRLRQCPNDVATIKMNTIDVMEGMDISVDGYRSDSTMPILKYTERLHVERYLPMRERVMVENAPTVIGHNMVFYPYHPYLTAKKVIADFIDNINLVIRGEDLVTEFSIYCYFCDVFRIPIPEHVYIPRLRTYKGEEISKSSGFPSVIKMLKSGMAPKDISQILRESCLIYPDLGFHTNNIVPDPRINKKDTDRIKFL